MFTTLLETQKAAVTIVAFIATFFLALAIGRFLKRRAGVRLGIFYSSSPSRSHSTPPCRFTVSTPIGVHMSPRPPFC